MTTFREINAAVKRHFGKHPAFVSAKADIVGSFSVMRFEGDLPMSLADAIARYVETNFRDFTGGAGVQRIMGFIEGGTIINWYAR